MAEQIIPSGYGKAVYRWQAPGGGIETVGHGYSFNTGSTATDVADACNDAIQGTGDLVTAANMLTGWTYLGVQTYQRLGTTLTGGESVASVAGTRNVSGVALNTAALVRVSTGFLGKQYRGRMFLPGAFIAYLDISGGKTLSAPVLESLNSSVETWFDALSALIGVLDVFLLHSTPKSGDIPPPTRVTSWSVQPNLATQRRRMN